MTPFQLEVAKAVLSLLTVIGGSTFAVWLYFRQKEYELVKQRYLEGAVDVLISQLETALGVVSHNFGSSLQIVKSFRDAGEHFKPKLLSYGFLQLDSSRFHQHANHRLETLLGSKLAWTVFQSAMAHAMTTNAVITIEIPEAMRIKRTTNVISRSEKEIAEKMVAELKEYHDAGHKYFFLVAELHYLGRLLETEKLSLSAIASFREREEVKQLLGRLSAAFPDEGVGV